MTDYKVADEKYRSLLDERGSVILCVNKPSIDVAKGYWVKVVGQEDMTDLGRVSDININLRIMSISYIKKADAYDRKSKYEIVSKQIPFDHPDLEWYHKTIDHPVTPPSDEKIDEPIITHRSLNSNQFEDLRKPELVDCTDGYLISFPSNGNRVYGKVVDKDITKRYIAVIFYNSPFINESEETIEWISYDDPNILWHKETLLSPRPKSIVSQPFGISDSLGYRLSHGGFTGVVSSVNHKNKILKVVSEEEIIEEIPWESDEIAWLSIPRPQTISEAIGYSVVVKTNQVFSYYPDLVYGFVVGINPPQSSVLVKLETTNNSEDIEEINWNSLDIFWFAKPIKPNRPNTIREAIGCAVAVYVENYLGLVIDGDELSGKVAVKFINTDDAEGEDIEYLDWLSPEIQWKPELTYRLLETWNQKPAFIGDAIGYRVEVANLSPEAVEGQEAFTGLVIDVNEKNSLVTIQFDMNNNEPPDIEEYDWNSLEILWLYKQPLRKKPITIDQSIGYIVRLSDGDPTKQDNDMFEGKVIGFNKSNGKIRVKFIGPDDMSIDGDINDFSFDDPDIVWVSKPWKPNNIRESVGHTVHIVSRLAGSQRDDMFEGKIVNYNDSTNKVEVKFIGEDDTSINEYEQYDWDSLDIFWTAQPEKAFPSSNGGKLDYRTGNSDIFWEAQLGAQPQSAIPKPESRARSSDIIFGAQLGAQPKSANPSYNRPESENWSRSSNNRVFGAQPKSAVTSFERPKSENRTSNSIPTTLPRRLVLSDKGTRYFTSSKPNFIVNRPIKQFIENNSVVNNNNRPAFIGDAIGYTVDVNEDVFDGEVFFGQVIGVNEKNGRVKIKFQTKDNKDPSDIEEYDWNSRNIMWKCKKPFIIDESIGYIVRLSDGDPTKQDNDMFEGKVIGFNKSNGKIRVKFIGPDDMSIDGDINDFSFDDPDIVWVSKPWKPNNIRESVGHTVHIVSRLAGSQRDDMFEGKIVNYNDSTNKVEVKFIGEDDTSINEYEQYDWDSLDIFWTAQPEKAFPSFNRASRGRIDNLPPLSNYKAESEKRNNRVSKPPTRLISSEKIPFGRNNDSINNSSPIHFITEPDTKLPMLVNSKSLIRFSKINTPNRPSSIHQSIGFNVEVPSRDFDAQEGDMFEGKVVSIDEARNKVTIKFFGDDAASIESMEEYDWDNEEICWISPDEYELGPIFSRHPFRSEAAMINDASNIPNHNAVDLWKPNGRPSSIHQSIGFNVEIPSRDFDAQEGDMFEGKIVSIDEARNKVTIKFIGDDDAIIDDMEEYDWDNKEIHWISPPENQLGPILSKSPSSADRVMRKFRFDSKKIPQELSKVHFPSTVTRITEEEPELTNSSEAVDFWKPNGRPLSIHQSIGYTVEVPSRDFDAQEGDMFEGKIVSIDEARNKVTIKFIGDDDAIIDDMEEYDWDNKEIHWISPHQQ